MRPTGRWGEFEGGPHPCGKPKKGNKHKDDYKSWSRFVSPI